MTFQLDAHQGLLYRDAVEDATLDFAGTDWQAAAAMRGLALCLVVASCSSDPQRPALQPARAARVDASTTVATMPAPALQPTETNDPLCRVPSGFPRALNGYALGSPLAPASAEPSATPLAEPGDFCLFGKPRLLGANGVVHSVAFRFLCDEESTFLGCNDLKGYVKRIGAALRVPVSTPADSLLQSSLSPPARYPSGPYVLRSADAELHIDPEVGFEAYSHVEVSLIQKTPDAICHDADGFSQFYADFLSAVARGARSQVLGFFRFPFADEFVVGSYSHPASFDAKTFPYDKFFQPAGPERHMPVLASCALTFGYLDFDWMPGLMVASRGADGWRWSRAMYVP